MRKRAAARRRSSITATAADFRRGWKPPEARRATSRFLRISAFRTRCGPAPSSAAERLLPHPDHLAKARKRAHSAESWLHQRFAVPGSAILRCWLASMPAGVTFATDDWILFFR